MARNGWLAAVLRLAVLLACLAIGLTLSAASALANRPDQRLTVASGPPAPPVNGSSAGSALTGLIGTLGAVTNGVTGVLGRVLGAGSAHRARPVGVAAPGRPTRPASVLSPAAPPPAVALPRASVQATSDAPTTRGARQAAPDPARAAPKSSARPSTVAPGSTGRHPAQPSLGFAQQATAPGATALLIATLLVLALSVIAVVLAAGHRGQRAR
ncbi:MAG: hypothetical protein ACR2LF_03130 [Jatrophihabitantaceae bacterium]